MLISDKANNMKLLKLSVELNSGTFSTSVLETFGIIPMDEMINADDHVSGVLPTLDYGDEDYMECEGYSEITFKIEWVEGSGYNWTMIDSFYHPLM
jgi:hypothetical protein